MDTAERNRASILKNLIDQGGRSRFFPSINLLERLFENAPRLGMDGPPRLESVRFRHDPSLRFAAGDIASIKLVSIPESGLNPARHVIQVETAFLGLTGTSSPLPSYIAEQIAHEDPDSPIRRDFLDVFHHRAISLFYRGVARACMPREHTSRKTSVWIQRGLTLAGIDAYDVAPTKVVPASSLLRMLPLLVGRARSARALQTALRHVLKPALAEGSAVTLIENLPGWLDIEPADRMALGQKNHALGTSTHLGVRAPERSGRFGIRIGPLQLANYGRFLPGGDQLPLIRETTQIFTRNPVDYDLELVVAANAVPSFHLTSENPAALGRTTWLAGEQSERVVVVSEAHRL